MMLVAGKNLSVSGEKFLLYREQNTIIQYHKAMRKLISFLREALGYVGGFKEGAKIWRQF